LSLDASYRYQAEVPSFAIAPGAPARPFGDHRTTTIGPTLNWTLWDEGALYRQWAAQKRRALSQDALARLARRQAALGARLAYFQVQLARERLALLDDSVSLADTQHADIAKRRRAGSASRLDDLFAHQEALRRRRDYLDAQSALGAAVSELLALTGGAEGLDAARAADARKPRAPADLPQPTLLVEVDALSVSTAALAAAAASPLDPAHPRLAAYEAMADAARLSARAAEAAGRPKLQLTARASYDYPNIPLLESVWQKTAGLSLSAPLLEFGRSKSEAGALRAQAAAAESRRAQAQDELVRDRAKSLERLASLETQAPILERSLAEADEVARLTYSAYQAGHSSLLEVQSANVRAVEARTERARADAEALIELAVLASLAPESP
ncbi:MAG TPA: TolC family protein, partial [Elusimicrobiota bacterium]|nr:TolC family protein [Elusimicrobiota bacterium]